MQRNEKIFLEGKIPIRLIQKPFCNICMDFVNQGEDNCYNCNHPPPIVENWYFNKVLCLGIYHSYGNDDDLSNKIPINIISSLIYLLKFKRTETFKNYAGKLFADGLFQLIIKNPEIFENTKYITSSPNFKKVRKINCEYIIKPLLRKMKENGFDVENILENTERLRDVGENKKKLREQRFNDISGIHNIIGMDFAGKKVLIIDDVYTTGSTVWDLARALKERNAGEINILVAGRVRSYNSWNVPENLDFYELILYFSYLDIDRAPKIIDTVKVKHLEVLDDTIKASFQGSVGDYRLLIDYKNKVIKHDCRNFIHKRMRIKKFCKHLTKTFIDLEEQNRQSYVKNLLNSIYLSLDRWEFKEF
ncbi:hypothetical protein LCGC14_1399010 [marine sediment metagenome]|uniref:Phosphoribosyltransferase domain-containing protein n=1 Tax=marine sediment metagenome TaxID=412755 RepID=A0A0F9JXV6_9ZZZZ|nr:hypothetical protein [archaeon]